jgi:hypothetical protein
MQKPSLPVSTGTNVFITIPYFQVYRIQARVEKIHTIHAGYVLFHISSTHPDLQFIAVPVDWTRLTRLQKIRFWRRLAQNTPFATEYEIVQDDIQRAQSEVNIQHSGDEENSLQVPQVIRQVRSVGDLTG